MKCPIEILPRALDDIASASAWYEERREGLASEFELTLQAALDTISEFPRLFPIVEDEIRRCLVGQFPYGLFYNFVDNKILVVAVFHASIDPKKWRERF